MPDAPQPIRTLASREVYANRWMRVREDEIEFPDGTAGRYGVVDKADFAIVIPWDGERFHLVTQYRYPVGERCLEFPQGGSEGEADPAEVARRELEEETGLRAGRLRRLGRLHHAAGFCSQSFHAFVAEDLGAGEQRLEPSEQGLEVVALTREELHRAILGGELRDGPSVAAYGLLRLGK
ncbi:MAG TPA: NUDIX hydrolase [Solirubrobacteraceae bacterium]|jgi:8-oxo-dGTP pyrophosphatase MutT (NUDIX family)